VIAVSLTRFLVTEVDRIPDEPYTGEIGALDDVRPGESSWGRGDRPVPPAGRAVLRGGRAPRARGTLVDGYCRDASRIAGLGYPVWCRGTLPLE